MTKEEILLQALTEWEENHWENTTHEEDELVYKMIEEAKERCRNQQW